MNPEIDVRLRQLTTHGLTGIVAGLLMLGFGVSAIIAEMLGPSARMSLGLLGIVAGGLVLLGILVDIRGRLLLIGMFGMAIWYALMTISFVATVFLDPPHLSPPWTLAAADPESRPYISVIYLTLTMLSIWHIKTLIRTPRRG